MAEAYRIADEPRPSTISHLTVKPLWPFFASMFGGAWLALPWFVMNGIAMGSPTLKREIALAVMALFGAIGLSFAVAVLLNGKIVPMSWAPYLILVVTVWKITFFYALYALQSRTFGIYEHFGGVVRNGLMVAVIGGLLLRRPVLESIGKAGGSYWVLVLN